jgi:protein phosphatase
MAGFLKKILGQQKSGEVEVSTEPLPASAQPTESEENVAPKIKPTQLIVGCAQSVGLQREHNEDSLFTLTSTLAGDSVEVPFGLYIVADGMGGHKHGEIASNLAARAMANQVIRNLYTPIFSTKPASPERSILEIMSQGTQDAHASVLREAPGGGTTLTAVLILGEQVTIAHVGDSRAYALRSDGSLQILTRDHSLVRRLVELGQITVEEAAYHPQRNVLYRAIGQSEPLDSDVSTHPLPHGGHLLVCSDGLWSTVPEKDLLEIIQTNPSPEIACQKLVEAANQAGGPDNITVILIRIPD